MAGKGDKGDKRPIVIKKVKKISGGHHGGAWKVAYADFVTAMMAFFLLLWLLSTSSKATLEGLAEYFTPTVGIADGKGIGFKGGVSGATIGIQKQDMGRPGLVVGQTPSGKVRENPDHPSPEESDMDDNLFKQGATALSQAFSNDEALQRYQDNVQVTQTLEGLRIDVMDSEKYPMFEVGKPVLTEHGQTILARMTGVIKRMPNYISITGHTDASPAESSRADYTNWELSLERANVARRFFLKSGMEIERPKKVVGMADKELISPKEPRSPRNRRIAIVMLRGSHMMIPDMGQHVAPSPSAEPAAPNGHLPAGP